MYQPVIKLQSSSSCMRQSTDGWPSMTAPPLDPGNLGHLEMETEDQCSGAVSDMPIFGHPGCRAGMLRLLGADQVVESAVSTDLIAF